MHEFYPRFTVLEHAETELPFSVGGVSQKGPHFGEDQNNQDAMSLLIRPEAIVAVVCDGCSGASPYGENSYSCNEFAAQFFSVSALKIIYKAIHYANKANKIDANIVKSLEKKLLKATSSLLEELECKFMNIRDHLLLELLTSTIVIAVVTKDNWYVLHGGDGIVIINGDVYNMESDSGIYVANRLNSKNSEPKKPVIKLLRQGKTRELENLTIATDGVNDFVAKSKESFIDFLSSDSDSQNVLPKTGYDYRFVREFRKRFSRKWSETERQDHDDRTLIAIRRVPEVKGSIE